MQEMTIYQHPFRPSGRNLFRMATQRVELGPTGLTVSENIAQLRTRSGLTLRQLANRMKSAGRPVSHTTISQIEAGSRRVTADELVAFAAALEVSPTTLLMPYAANPETKVEASGMEPTSALELWRWLTATAGRPPGSDVEVDLAWIHRARPTWTFRQLSDDELIERLHSPGRTESERRVRERGND